MTGARKAKILEGVVVSNKMDRTVTVEVERKFRHPLYKKVVIRSTKFYAHDESDAIEMGKRVRIEETRPLSKLKRWRVVEVLQ
jgi:small subunit ribosomal protein S17